MFGKKAIEIKTVAHRVTGLLMAYSDDLKGLVVHARSEDELEQKLPQAVRELLEARGIAVDSVAIVRDEDTPSGFGPAAFIANAHLTNQNCDA